MKFYGSGTVWDKEKNKALCKFKNGELETEDKRTQEILMNLGYEFKEVVINLESLGVRELKELAKEKGLEGYSKLKKDELINALKG